MDIFKMLKYNLANNADCNDLYFFGDKCPGAIDEVRNMLKIDYGFLDIIVDKDDILNVLKDLNECNSCAKRIDIRDRFIKMIYEKIGVKKDDEFYYFDYLRDDLKEKSLEYPNKQFRIHIMLDYVNDPDLQVMINDMIADRCFYVFGYTTRNLLTYAISTGFVIQDIHDYRRYVNENVLDRTEESGFGRTRID